MTISDFDSVGVWIRWVVGGLTTAILGIGVYVMNLVQRLQLVENRLDDIHVRSAEDRKAQSDFQRDVRVDLQRIYDKIDLVSKQRN